MTANSKNSQTGGLLNLDEKPLFLPKIFELKESKLKECLNKLKNDFRAKIKGIRNCQSEMEKSLSNFNFESKIQSKQTEEDKQNKVVSHSKGRQFTITGSYFFDSYKIRKFQLQTLSCSDSTDHTWKIAHVLYLEEDNWESASQEFPLTNHLCNAQVGFKTTKAGLECEFIFVDFRKTGQIIPFKLLPDIAFILEPQTNNKNGKAVLGRRHMNISPFNTVFKFGETACKKLIPKEQLLEPEYNVDDIVSISVSVGPSSNARHTRSFDGTLRCVLERYEHNIKDFRLCHRSPYFYTSPCGYKVDLSICAQVWNSCSYLAAYITFVTGEFDASLSTDFPHQTTFTIYNGNDLSQFKTVKIKKYVKINNKGYFFNVCELETADKFVYNDQLIYKVTIEELFY